MSNTNLPWSAVSLRPLDMLDPQEVQAWQNNPEIRDRTMGFRFPIPRAGVEKWIADAAPTIGCSNIKFSVFDEEIGVGVAMLRHIDWINRGADLGVCIGAPDARGKGIGFVACTLLVDYAFSGLGLQRIGLEVAASNTGAISLYERLGFQHEGTRRKSYFVSGCWEDVRLFGILKEEFNLSVPTQAHRLVFRSLEQ